MHFEIFGRPPYFRHAKKVMKAVKIKINTVQFITLGQT